MQALRLLIHLPLPRVHLIIRPKCPGMRLAGQLHCPIFVAAIGRVVPTNRYSLKPCLIYRITLFASFYLLLGLPIAQLSIFTFPICATCLESNLRK